MSPGAKIFVTVAVAGGVFALIAVAASKKAGAATLPKEGEGGTVVVPPHEGLPPVVTPSQPEGGFDRTGPFAVPGVQDAAEASRNLLGWWLAEGRSLVAADSDPSRPNVPVDYGSQAADLSGTFGARTQLAAKAFQHYNGLTPEDGVLSNPLVLALRRWASSQNLPQEALPPAQSSAPPAPIVLPSAPPLSSAPPPFVPLPPIAPQNPPVVPVGPVLPPLPNASNAPPVLTLPTTGPNPLPPGPVPAPPTPVPNVPLPPIVQPATPQAPPQPAATTVSADTAVMVNELLNAEAKAGWNKADPTVQAWQKPRGLKLDGLFGPKTALTVAQEFGTVPIIRVWPAGSTKQKALQDYRAALVELAGHTTDPTHAAQLRVSAQREQGQGFGPKRGSAPAIPNELQVKIGKVA